MGFVGGGGGGGGEEALTLIDQRMQTLGNEYFTTSVEFVCGKVCKNLHGLKIHQAKMKCM